jgi:hypothetical protein
MKKLKRRNGHFACVSLTSNIFSLQKMNNFCGRYFATRLMPILKEGLIAWLKWLSREIRITMKVKQIQWQSDLHARKKYLNRSEH